MYSIVDGSTADFLKLDFVATKCYCFQVKTSAELTVEIGVS